MFKLTQMQRLLLSHMRHSQSTASLTKDAVQIKNETGCIVTSNPYFIYTFYPMTSDLSNKNNNKTCQSDINTDK